MKYLNEILSDKYGNISDECIEYFKNNLHDLNNKYIEYEKNKLAFFTKSTQIKQIEKFIFLNTIYSVNNTYVGDNYKYNPLREQNYEYHLCNHKIITLLKHILMNYDTNIHEKKGFIDFMYASHSSQDTNKIIKILLNNKKSNIQEYNDIIKCVNRKIHEYINNISE
jgi:hypothetical protein